MTRSRPAPPSRELPRNRVRTRSRSRFTAVVSLLSLAAQAGAAPAAQDVGRVRWSHFDEGASWVPDDISVGDDGAAVFAGLLHNAPDLRLFPGGSAEPVFATLPDVGLFTLRTKVALADSAPVAVSLTTHQTTSGSQDPDIVAIVRAYDVTGDGQPLWEHVLPESDWNTTPGVAVSDEGDVVLVWWSVEDLGGMLVTAWDADGAQISQSVIPHANGSLWPDEAALSRDGSTALFSLPLLGQAVVYDVPAGKVKASVVDNGIFSGHALSGDGRRIAGVHWDFQVGYRLRVYELDAQDQPVPIFEEIYSEDSFRVPAVALDHDGSRVAYSVQKVNPTTAFTIHLRDLDAGQELFAKKFGAPKSTLQLWGIALQLDDAGETVACANWGDSLNKTPEVLALDDQGNVLVGVDARGSALYVDLSRDGELLAAGCKATHATLFGSGGDVYLVETRANRLRLEGTPRLGEELELSVHADPEFDRAILLASDALADAPLGDLRLDVSAGRRVLGTYALQSGQLETRFEIPLAFELAGTAAHFQAVLVDDDTGARKVTNKVSVRFLP